MRRSTAITRFKSAAVDPDQAIALRPDHPAAVEGRTIFPTTVVGSMGSPRLLVSGHNNPKLGKEVQKGDRQGWPIFHLTLEERATCPRSCVQWEACYGNAMPQARRHAVDDDFLDLLKAEVATVARQHRNGLLIRLHTLGDFYSGEYVFAWAELLMRFPQLHVFGYTARRVDDADRESARIAKAIAALTSAMWSRFAIRTSHADAGPQRSIVVDAPVERANVIMCPAQVEKTAACATCGLCWVDRCRDKTIAFLRHGMKRTRAPRAEPNTATIHELRNPAGGTIPSSQGGARAAEAVTGDSPVASAPTASREPTIRGGAAVAALHRAMLELADREGIVSTNRVRLANAAGVKLTSLPNYVAALVDEGLVELVAKGGGRGRPSVYRVRRTEDPPFRSFRSVEAPQDLPPPQPQAPPAMAARFAEVEVPTRKRPGPRDVVEEDFEIEPEDPPTSGPCTLLSLRRKQCHWPIGAPRPIQHYCAKPVVPGEQYCGAHLKAKFEPGGARKTKPADPREADRRAEAARQRRLH